MFYSHEILTNRKHGVATIWLVATLGSKSALKKVTRKAIMNVNVTKACDAIENPSQPLALRLQAGLLYGISKVFSQQCGYVLNDMQSLRDTMRGVTLFLKEMQLDPEVTINRPDQINISEDPYFNLDFNINFDLSAFESTNTSITSSQSSHTLASSQTSAHEELDDGQDIQPERLTLENEYDDPFDIGNDLAFTQDAPLEDNQRLDKTSEMEQGVVQRPDFEICKDGTLRMLTSGGTEDNLMNTAEAGRSQSSMLEEHSDVSARVRAEHEAVLGAAALPHNLDDDSYQLNIGEDDDTDPLLPEVVSSTTESQARQTHQDAASPKVLNHNEEGNIAANAPQNRFSRKKIMEADIPAELGNKQLTAWNKEYLVNMKNAHERKATSLSLAQARRNAAFWVLDQGIGGVLVNYGSDAHAHPLAAFSGESLLQALVGESKTQLGKRRSRSISADMAELDESKRRVRSRTEEPEVVRDDAQQRLDGDEEGIVIDDEYQPEAEMGRQAPPSLREHSSDMPWNLSSRAGSELPHGSMRYGVDSSVRGIAAAELGPPSALVRSRSRFTSASPLVGKGRLSSNLSNFGIHETNTVSDEEDMDFSNLDAALAGDLAQEDFELYGPAAEVSTQEATNSQWLAKTMEGEAQNFLSFVTMAIRSKVHETTAELNDHEEISITFEELLAPEKNSRIVAAQGFLHVLALTTRGVLEVTQDEPYGEFSLTVVVRTTEEVMTEGDEAEEL